MPDRRPILLFMCVANSSRSQMAEGLARTLAPPGLDVASAGSEPTQLNPLAVRALKEVGVDISGHYAKTVAAVSREQVATVITLCAEEVCPVFPGAVQRHHWPFEDPAAARGSEEERLAAFRRVRDQIQARLEAYFGATAD